MTNTVLFAVVVDGFMYDARFATREEADMWTASDEHDDGEFDEYEVVEVEAEVLECLGHESTLGPAGVSVYCDGTCRVR